MADCREPEMAGYLMAWFPAMDCCPRFQNLVDCRYQDCPARFLYSAGYRCCLYWACSRHRPWTVDCRCYRYLVLDWWRECPDSNRATREYFPNLLNRHFAGDLDPVSMECH